MYIEVHLPDLTTTPVTTTYNPTRTFTATFKIKVVGTSSYAGGVTADVIVAVYEDGEITAGGILGVNLAGNPVALSTGALSVQTRVKIGGAAGGVVPHSVAAPQFLFKLMDSKPISTIINSSRNDTPFAGTAFPKTLDVVVESSGSGSVSYVNVPLVGPVHGLAYTTGGDPGDPYEASWWWPTDQPQLTDFRIVP